MNSRTVAEKSMEFAVRVVNAYKYLTAKKKEYIMSKQLLRCGTSIGANIAEAKRGQSKADFTAKMSIALKEASEAEYWLRVLYRTNYFSKSQFDSLNEDVCELLRMLVAICKKSSEK